MSRHKKTALAILALLVSSPLHAQPPQADQFLWLRADLGTEETDGRITSWTDQSPNGTVFTAPGQGPVLVGQEPAAGNQPVLRFSGSEQLNGSVPNTTLGEATVFAVVNFTIPSSDNDYLYTFGNSGRSGSQFTLSRYGGDTAYHYDGSRANRFGRIPGSGFLISVQEYGGGDPAGQKLTIDSRVIQSTLANGSYQVNAGTMIIGDWSSGGYRFVGDLAEIIVYDRVLSPEERAEVEDYLLARYGRPGYRLSTATDFSDWEVVQYEVFAQPNANWVIAEDGLSVDQLVNCDPSMLLSQATFSRGTIQGEIGSGTAPDFMGFVFGFQDRGRFYAFDWKKIAASYQDFGTAPAGMRLRKFHVDGDPDGGDFWSSANPEHVTVLRQNNIPWEAGVVYDYSLVLEPGIITIEIKNDETVLESWIVEDDTYPTGRFGYYVNSLQNVFYGRLDFNILDAPGAGELRISRTDIEGQYLSLGWEGGAPPYTLEESDNIGNWTVRGSGINGRSITLPAGHDVKFFRVKGSQTVD